MPEDDQKLNTQPDAPQKPAVAPRRRSRAFRRGLLSKLPRLSVARWDTKDTLDVYQDMQGIAEVDADSFLQQLKPMNERRHG